MEYSNLTKEQLNELRKACERVESYELAAEIRDEIRSRKRPRIKKPVFSTDYKG